MAPQTSATDASVANSEFPEGAVHTNARYEPSFTQLVSALFFNHLFSILDEEKVSPGERGPSPSPLPVSVRQTGSLDVLLQIARRNGSVPPVAPGQLSSLVFGLGFNVKKEKARLPRRPPTGRGMPRSVFIPRRAGRRAKRQHRDNIRAPPRYIAQQQQGPSLHIQSPPAPTVLTILFCTLDTPPTSSPTWSPPG